MPTGASGQGPAGPRHQGADTRREQPAVKAQQAHSTKQRASVAQESSITDPKEAMQQQAQGAEQGIHIYQWAPAAGSSPAAPSQVMAAQGHGRGGREQNRGNLARGASCGAQAPRKGWASRPFGVLGSPPLAVYGKQGSKTTTLADRPLEWPSPGCLGPLPVWRSALTGRALLTQGFLGPFLAVCTSSSNPGGKNKAGTGSLRTPTTQCRT